MPEFPEPKEPFPWEHMTLRMTRLFQKRVVQASTFGWKPPDPLFWLKKDLPDHLYCYSDGSSSKEEIMAWRRRNGWD